MRLCEGLRSLLGGKKYVKQRELTRAVLLNLFAKQNGYIVPVTLIEVNVTTFGGTTFDIFMEEGSSTVHDLKRASRSSTARLVSHSSCLYSMCECVKAEGNIYILYVNIL